jgi:hypothetical protein
VGVRRAIQVDERPGTATQQAESSSRRQVLLGVAAGVVVGAIYFIGAGRALDYDGSVTVGSFVRHGRLLDVFRTTYAFNNHPYFSFVEHLVWDAGGHSEASLRLVPIVCATVTVGLLAMWCARRWGMIEGLVAGSVLAANPLYAQLSRSVRGYSLMVLGCTVATLLLIDARGRKGSMPAAQTVMYVIAFGVAVGAQAYSALVLAAHIAILISERRWDTAWRRRIEAVIAIGAVPYVATLRQLFDAARTRKGYFETDFPLVAARELLGHQFVAVIALAVLTTMAFSTYGVRRRLGLAFAAIAIELLIVWVVLHPFDLYPRFVVWLVPAVALAAAAAVAHRPWTLAIVGLAVGAMVISQTATWSTDPVASRQMARIVEAVRANGQQPCAAGYSTEVLLGYTRAVPSARTVRELEGCDLVFGVVDSSARQLAEFRCHFAHRDVLAGQSKIVVLTRPTASRPSGTCTAA